MKKKAVIVGVAVALAGAILVARKLAAVRALERLAVKADGAREGSWLLPRGGPYIFGFDSPGDAQLWVGGRLVANGAGEKTSRVIFPAGVQEVRFLGPKEATLLWHPPGRRGAPEIVPPSSLSPDPPDRARFGAGAGAWWLEAAAAWGVLLLAAGVFLFLWRPRVDRAVLAIFLVALAARLIGLNAAGQTWDEDEYWCSGKNYLLNLLDFDFRARAWRWNHEHPPLTKYVAGLGALWQDGYGTARALFAVLGAGTCALICAIGRRLFGGWAGVFAGITAAFLPRLIAHDRVVGHETTSVFFWALAIWAAVRAGEVEEWPALARRVALVGVAIGLAVSTRFSNLLLLPAAFAVLLAATPVSRLVRVIDLGSFLMPAVGAATFVAVWPRMWHAPGRHLSAAWNVLKRQHLPEYYLGEWVQLPDWHYFPVYFLATTPVLVLACVFALAAWRGAARRERAMFVGVALLLVPLGVAYSPVRQDGVRYVLPMLLGAALLAGAGLDHLVSALKKPRAAWIAAGALGVYLAVTCARVYPYYLDYYAEPVGGPAKVAAKKWFEIGWWGEGIAEAVDYVNANAEKDATVYRLIQPTHVNWFRDDLWQETTPTEADWVVVSDFGQDAAALFGLRRITITPDLELVKDVKAQGASLVRVYRRRR